MTASVRNPNDNGLIIETVQSYRDAGLQPIPIRADGSKAPALQALAVYFDPANQCPFEQFHGQGVGIVGGRASGGLEVIDFDDPSYYPLWCELVEDQSPGLIQRLVMVDTPRMDDEGNHGIHVYYRCDEPGGSVTLAQFPVPDEKRGGVKPKKAIETKAEGGYVLAPGSPAACHPTGRTYEVRGGKLTDLPHITMDERNELFNAARALNKWTKVADHGEANHKDIGHATTDGVSPGDAYAAATSWDDILLPHEWKSAGPDLWTRPGKGRGVSASTRCVSEEGNELFKVFSTDAYPFEGDKTYTKFAAYTYLNHNGDFSEAAKDLAGKGFGDQTTRSTKHPKPEDIPLENGFQVLCGDQQNVGTVIQDNGRTATVQFVSQHGNNVTKELPKTCLRAVDGSPIVPGPRREIKVIPASEFVNVDYRPNWLVKRVLVAKQPAVCGGRSKAMKTSLLVDLAVSIGSGTPFLGHFETTKATVAILSGESGAFTIQETAKRVSAARGIDLGSADVFFGFTLPQITSIADVDATTEMLLNIEADVLIVDPAYLCLLGGESNGRQASNVFDMGPLLLRLSEVGEMTDSTVILCHHCRKSPGEGRNRYEPPDLEELSMAGFAEWARQWLLVGRREPFEPGIGDHKLWLNVGGSAGFSGTWSVDIGEGLLNADFTGRQWDVKIGSVQDAREAKKRGTEKKKTEERERREWERRQKVIRVLKGRTNGLSKNKMRERTGMNGEKLAMTLLDLEQQGLIKTVDGKSGNQNCELYFLAEQCSPEAKPDKPDRPDKKPYCPTVRHSGQVSRTGVSL